MRRLAALGAAAVLCLAAQLGALPLASASPISDCTSTTGTIIAVDYAHWGGPIVRGCDTGNPAHGNDLFDDTGFVHEGTVHDGPYFICRIGNAAFHGGTAYPTPADEACNNTPPASAYWSYWLAQAGQNHWTYSQLGAYSEVPKKGEVELWIFGGTHITGSQGNPTDGFPTCTPASLRAGGAPSSCTPSAGGSSTEPGGSGGSKSGGSSSGSGSGSGSHGSGKSGSGKSGSGSSGSGQSGSGSSGSGKSASGSSGGTAGGSGTAPDPSASEATTSAGLPDGKHGHQQVTVSLSPVDPAHTLRASSAWKPEAGKQFALAATVAPVKATGSVRFATVHAATGRDGKRTLTAIAIPGCKAVALTHGLARCALSLPGGSHTVQAVYSGSSTFRPALARQEVVVGPAAPAASAAASSSDAPSVVVAAQPASKIKHNVGSARPLIIGGSLALLLLVAGGTTVWRRRRIAE